MLDATQDRLDALRQLAAETQKRVTAKGIKPVRRHRDGSRFKNVTLVEIERAELIFLCDAITNEEARGQPIWQAQEQGSRLAKGETVAIKLSDLHWLLSYAPQRPDPAASKDDADEVDTELAESTVDPYVAETAGERVDRFVDALEETLGQAAEAESTAESDVDSSVE